MNKRQSGFSILVLVTFLFVCGAIGAVGVYALKLRDSGTGTVTFGPKSDPNATNNKPAPAPVDPTEGWKTHSNAIGNYSFKYPSAWILAPNLDKCSENAILLGADANSVGQCASSNAGQIRIASITGDVRDRYTFKEVYYSEMEEKEITVAGVTGAKYSTTVLGMNFHVVNGSLPDKTKIVRYVFFTGDKTYVASYVQEPSYPDALKDFNLLVTRTLKFAP